MCLPQVIRYCLCYAWDIGRNWLWSMFCIYKVYLNFSKSNRLTQAWQFIYSLLLGATCKISNSSCAFLRKLLIKSDQVNFRPMKKCLCCFITFHFSYHGQYCSFHYFSRSTISVIWCCSICANAVYISINSCKVLVSQSQVFTNQIKSLALHYWM